MESAEFDEFYAASYPRVTRQIYAMIGNLDEAQECVQEAFAKAWAHRRRLQRVEAPERWVRTTAYRLAVSRWRRVQLARRAPDRATAASAVSPPPNEAHMSVVAALRLIPEAQRQAIVLHHIADLPVHEVAAELGVAEGTIKARLSRGRAALASLLDDTNGLPGELRHA